MLGYIHSGPFSPSIPMHCTRSACRIALQAYRNTSHVCTALGLATGWVKPCQCRRTRNADLRLTTKHGIGT